MIDIPQLIAKELSINLSQVNNALELFAEGSNYSVYCPATAKNARIC